MDELAREIKTMRPGDPRRAQIVQEIIRLTITCIKPATERYFRLGVLPLRLIFLFATPTDLLAESCFSQETLIFHGVVRLVVISLIPSNTNLSYAFLPPINFKIGATSTILAVPLVK